MALNYIQKLYDICQQQANPIIEKLHVWLTKRACTGKKSLLKPLPTLITNGTSLFVI